MAEMFRPGLVNCIEGGAQTVYKFQDFLGILMEILKRKIRSWSLP